MNRWLQEPLVHFVLLGGLLFAAYSLLDRDAMDTPQVVRISAAEVDWLKHTWSRQWQRPPDESELRGLVTGYLKEVLLAREAQVLGLAENDTVVRRRLAQKMEFLVEDTARLAEPDEKILRQYFVEHRTQYLQPSIISFTQLYFNTKASAREALGVLKQNPLSQVGERSLLPRENAQADEQTIVNLFGQKFASKIFTLAPNRWQGPVVSAHGFHLVHIHDVQPVQMRAFEETRAQVLEDWYRIQQERASAQFLAALYEKYDVIVDDGIAPLIGPLDEAAQ